MILWKVFNRFHRVPVIKFQDYPGKVLVTTIIIITIIIITMARQPYMGLGLLFPRLRGLCAFAAVRDLVTIVD
jgi:hypothetical protein